MLISFSGLDGAGKSTLIGWLREELERQDRPVAVFHMTDDIGLYAYIRAMRDGALRLVGRARPGDRSADPSGAGDKAPRRGLARIARRVRNGVLWNRPIRRLIYPFDLLVFLAYRLYYERLRGQVLIMDRYFYDSLVDVADGRHWGWLRRLEAITCTPTVPVLLDITPEESWTRKGEHSPAYLRHRWAAYREVFRWIPSSVVLENRDFDATKRVLRRLLAERMAVTVAAQPQPAGETWPS